jgi:hypothetical protein
VLIISNLVIHFTQVVDSGSEVFTTEAQRAQRNSIKTAGFLCVLCVSSERSERVVEKIIGLPLSTLATGTKCITRISN